MTKKQVKALKKLQKKAFKQAKKEGKSVDEVLTEKSEDIKAITEQPATTETSKPADEKQEKAEPVVETATEQKTEVPTEPTVSKEDEMLLVLREIRDSLKSSK